MIIEEEDYIKHYGILRKSGRYPYGSGGHNEGQLYPWAGSSSENVRNSGFLSHVEALRAEGMSEVEIARGLGIPTTQLRAAKTIATNQQRQHKIKQIQRYSDKGMSNVAIGERMGLNESTVRSLKVPGAAEKASVLTNTADVLKKEVDSGKFIDVGRGAENHLGVTNSTLKGAVAIAREEGYELRYVKVRQLGTGKETTVTVLAPPGSSWSDVNQNRDKIAFVGQKTDDFGRTFYGMLPPLGVDASRVAVVYGPEGGDKADGVMYVRKGVDDVSLGDNHYAQVRVKVGDKHYIKGMAIYKDDMPKGVDIVFNTNKDKPESGDMLEVLKPLKADRDNPFGAVVDQITTTDADGTVRLTSAMNLVNEQGDWNEWSRNLATQMLSKQKPTLAKQQLDMTFERRQTEYDEIMALTNPTVRRKLLQEFADGTDAAAVHLKAAALPRQRTQVLLPVDSLKDTEIYAPNFKNGENVVLVRYPHGGTFEIPQLRVNNRHPDSKALVGNSEDAVAINSRVASRLSGADFDGDTVLVIPNGTSSRPGKVRTSPALEQLKDFDPHKEYAAYPGMPKVKPSTMQGEMGKVSNLITDMTIMQASNDEIARAVRHSMVVIDSEKHNLDYKTSAKQNGIPALKRKYQGRSNAGATTIISRATSEDRIDERKPRPAADGGPIDRKTGKLVYVPTGNSYVNKKGETVTVKEKKERLAITDDAFTLVSEKNTPVERIYATHSNKLKGLANDARREMVNTPLAKTVPSAKKTYAKEVTELNAALDIAQRNAPRERQAQLLANNYMDTKKKSNPGMSKEEIKREESQALEEMRARVGAKKTRIEVTPKQWEAIQAGAVSDTNLSSILASADMDVVKSLATPRVEPKMTSAKTTRAQSMLNSGYTRAEVAAQLGVSVTTLDKVTDAGG